MWSVSEAAARLPGEGELGRLAAQGVAGLVVPPAFEGSFYRHGNLPEQLRRLFAPLNPARLDEDVLEGLCDRASALIRTSYLMDDAVQELYRGLNAAGLTAGDLHVRRPGEVTAEAAAVVPPGTAALHALKRLWARDWNFDAVLSRLEDTGSVALEARPTLMLAGPPGVPDAARAAALGVPVALVGPLGLVGLP